MFYKCFTIFFQVFYYDLQVFQDVLLCFTMFSESRNDRQLRIGDRTAADRLRDRDNAAGISAEIGDDTAGIIDIAAKVIPC